jgi:hypothetical protein
MVRKGFPKLEGWETTVQVLSDDGILTYYMHLAPDSIPPALRTAIDRKQRIEAGSFLGKLYRHRSPPSHVHFGAADCQRHLRLNPLRYLDYTDTTPPTLTGIVVHRPGDKAAKDLGARVNGDVDLTLLAYDSIDGMPELFPIDRLDLEIVSESRGRIFRSTVFDDSETPTRASREDGSCQYLTDYDWYEEALGNTMYRRYWPDGFKKNSSFPIALTAQTSGLPSHLQTWYHPCPGPWRTKLYPTGTYRIQVTAFDAKGNSSSYSRTIEIAN